MNKVPHPCVLPRRRFVRGVVVMCLLAVLGVFGVYREFVPEFFAVFMVEVVMLLLPSRTKSGTLVQLLGLMMPCSAVAILLFGGAPGAARGIGRSGDDEHFG